MAPNDDVLFISSPPAEQLCSGASRPLPRSDGVEKNARNNEFKGQAAHAGALWAVRGADNEEGDGEGMLVTECWNILLMTGNIKIYRLFSSNSKRFHFLKIPCKAYLA